MEISLTAFVRSFQPRDVLRYLNCALSLHLHGVTDIETSAQAAGASVRWLENSPKHSSPSGLSAGLLAFPTLTCSAAYALAETFDWNHGLNQRFAVARRFYFVIILSTLIGIILDFADVSPVKALFWGRRRSMGCSRHFFWWEF